MTTEEVFLSITSGASFVLANDDGSGVLVNRSDNADIGQISSDVMRFLTTEQQSSVVPGLRRPAVLRKFNGSSDHGWDSRGKDVYVLAH